MKNLHLICSGLTDEVKLLIVNWHIAETWEPNRRVGRIAYENGRFWVCRRDFHNQWTREYEVSEKQMEGYLQRRNIPIDYFNDDMIAP